MESTNKLVLDRDDIRDAVIYWLETCHDFAFDSGRDYNDRVILPRNQGDIKVILNTTY